MQVEREEKKGLREWRRPPSEDRDREPMARKTSK